MIYGSIGIHPHETSKDQMNKEFIVENANKYKKIRAGICWNVDIVKLIRQHNNANILCIPSRFVSVEDALLMVDVFIQTEFDGGRHQNRINKINLSKF